ncbi:hypothetical protein WMF37_21865 [Sorangium sp. So ce291]|uniref:hypothetical protein n=1 Tax=Sorangium sp. So ce291 TaxID=3133294 RepID=UPI003F5E1AC2
MRNAEGLVGAIDLGDVAEVVPPAVGHAGVSVRDPPGLHGEVMIGVLVVVMDSSPLVFLMLVWRGGARPGKS